MKKTLLTAALACVLSIFGFVATAQESTVTLNDGKFSSNVSKNLSLLVATSTDVDLSAKLASVSSGEKTFGYKKNGTFVSLAQAVSEAQVATVGEAKVTSISLGEFNKDDTIQFGYNGGDNVFHPYSPFKIESDPGYYGGYNADSFYKLDFSEDPFNGMIEIYVIGEPLPAPAVTLIVALAAGALFLLYKNRGRRSAHTEQA
ncbi:MAG: hypothetical protein J6Y92_04670 [Lentisphaeria bacterium]|nr:hypothetical protein [Lentisphaeria bacterium]